MFQSVFLPFLLCFDYPYSQCTMKKKTGVQNNIRVAAIRPIFHQALCPSMEGKKTRCYLGGGGVIPRCCHAKYIIGQKLHYYDQSTKYSLTVKKFH